MADAVRMMRSWRGIYRVPGLDADQMREVARIVARILITFVFGYCALVGWDVVQTLREVKLSQLRDVLSLVSVGDALLLLIGWSLAREIVRSLARRRSPS
jgi:hypothetical protein